MKIKKEIVFAFPPGSGRSYIKSETFYDKAGNEIEYKSYKSGKVLTWQKFVYDKQNELINTINLLEYSKAGQGERLARRAENRSEKTEEVVEINDKGQTVRSSFNATGIVTNRKIFNENNICIEEHEFKRGSITKRTLYNDRGEILDIRNFRIDGSPLNYEIRNYNANGQLILCKRVSRTGYLTELTVYKYDSEGLLIEEVGHPVDPDKAFADVKGGSSGYSNKYFYNKDKLLETHNLYLCGELIMVYKYSYEFWQ